MAEFAVWTSGKGDCSLSKAHVEAYEERVC